MSGLFWRGTPAQILDAWRDRRYDLLISPEIYAEYERVGDELRATRPHVDPRAFLQLVLSTAVMVDARELEQQVCSDPDDDKFIACGLDGGAEFLVTGDKALLTVRSYRGLQIVTPARFLKERVR
jgi:putative PIN family toxin of toxin-antitoxin system